MSNSLTAETKEILAPSVDGKTLIITIGNSLRSDDGVGPYIGAGITSPGKNVIILNAGDRPDAIITEAINHKPKKVLIIDAAHFGAPAGTIKKIDRDSVGDVIFSTHTFPLTFIAKIIEEDTGAYVHFIGIQTGRMGYGEGLSSQVKNSADKIINFYNSRV